MALAVGVFVFYAVEASLRHTPWIFTDELEWSQISRAINATGHAARRGEPISFKSIYVFLLAPFWWIRSTATAYAAIKYMNVVVMTLTAFPVYKLARMVVTRRGAIVAALLSVAVPAMSYVTTIIIEVLAYPYYAFCSWLSVRALRSGRRRDVILAIVVGLGGLLVRSPQFVTISISFVIAAALLWVTGPRGRALRRNWTRGDTIGAIALLLGAGFLVNRVVLQHVLQWQYSTEYAKPAMVDLGLRAALSMMVALAFLPVICGIVALRLPDRRGDPAYRAFAAWLGASIIALGLYTAVKAAYLSSIFGTYWEERNIIYLEPLLLIATVLVFESKRIDWRLVAAGSALVAVTVIFKPWQSQWPYFEAPGMAIPAVLHDYAFWSTTDLRLGALALLAVSLLLLAFRRRRGVAALALLLGLTWLLGGEITNTVGIDREANAFRVNLPATLNWIDLGDHGQPATYLGQTVTDANGEMLAEFWNRSLTRVDTLDGNQVGPGPTNRPLVVSRTGLLTGITTRYVVGDVGVDLDATRVAAGGKMVLYYSSTGRWHLLDNLEQVYTDGWCPQFCAWTYFKPGQRGTLEVTLARTGYKGSAPAGRAMIQVGTVGVAAKGIPYMVRIEQTRHAVIRNGAQETLPIPVSRTPLRVEVTFDPSSLITPALDPGDARTLGAQIGFRFVPTHGSPTRSRTSGGA